MIEFEPLEAKQTNNQAFVGSNRFVELPEKKSRKEKVCMSFRS